MVIFFVVVVTLAAVEAARVVVIEVARVVVVEAARVAVVEAARVVVVAVEVTRWVFDDTYEVCASVVGALLASLTVVETLVLLPYVQSNLYAAPPFLTCDGFEHSLLMRPQSFDTL